MVIATGDEAKRRRSGASKYVRTMGGGEMHFPREDSEIITGNISSATKTSRLSGTRRVRSLLGARWLH